MVAFQIAAYALLYSLAWATSIPPASQVVLTPQHSHHILRPLTKEDLPDLTRVFIDAFKNNAIHQYLHLDTEKWENYTYHCSLEMFHDEWDRHNELVWANVIVVPQEPPDGNGRKERVVSFAAWKWLVEEDSTTHASHWMGKPYAPGGKCSDHLDVNTTRYDYFAGISRDIMTRYVYNFKRSQLLLNLIATHPDWDGHNFAAEQIEVGLQKAAEAEMPVALIGTPAGYPLYDSLGFKSLANITIERMDHDGSFWMEYMRWSAKPEQGE